MTKYISILRGINVAGKRKLLMGDLKELYTQMGCFDVITYIQSGNVIFQFSDEPCAAIENSLASAILKQFGYDVPVIVYRMEDWKTIIKSNPFTDSDFNNLYITLLKDLPNASAIKDFESMDFSPDQFQIIGKCIYIHCHGKYHQSRLSNTTIEKLLKVTATTRNWKTVLKLQELLEQ